ncbi:Hypothetical predicted protein [Lynx pardinus]|uniref:Uncharacterized protein n=1 Tax=Lynx pardinus TaxID=191816 RepID=A0A485NJF5_LYNPA|nr:Hypothetical predicted protein [Lynx pardinus]
MGAAAACRSPGRPRAAAVVRPGGLFWVVDQACLEFGRWRPLVCSGKVHTPPYSFLFHRCAAACARARSTREGGGKSRS